MTFLKLILRSALVISILIACNHRLLGIDFNKINTGYWYDVEAPVRVQHRVAQLHDSLYVFVRIQADSAIHTFNHLLQKDMADPDNHLLFAGIDTLSHSINEIVYRIAFRVPPQKLLVVHFIGQTDQFYFPIDLSRGNYSHPDYYPAGTDGRPVFDSYLVPGKFEFRFLGMPDTLFCFQYPEDFPAADPPMNASPILSPSLVPDSLLRVYGKPELADGNMYFVQKDTLSAIASAFYCAPYYFPKQRKIDELIGPLVYISKKSEMNAIREAPDLKRAFDEYWLSLYSAKHLASQAIREYYVRVRQANALFTDYKQGWKTDRGMVYVVRGRPDEVYRGNWREVWKYENGDSFEFRIISNLFAPRHYVLMRDQQYEGAWFQAVRLLREGR